MMKNSPPPDIGNYDSVVTIGASRIQHGKYNDRIYLMRLSGRDGTSLLPKLDRLAKDNGYSKIFAKAPAIFSDGFTRNGYRIEAAVPRFFEGRRKCCFFCKYFDPKRAVEDSPETLRKNLAKALERAQTPSKPVKLSHSFSWRRASAHDAEAISKVYRRVFETYPFPIHDPEYIRSTMRNNTVYFCIYSLGEPAAVSSAEISQRESAAEMTDFATLPVYRGHRFARFLLARMEEEIQRRNIKTAYTIARAMSGPMNAVFAARGYLYGGTLTKNTQICGRLESMNVWHKQLGGGRYRT